MDNIKSDADHKVEDSNESTIVERNHHALGVLFGLAAAGMSATGGIFMEKILRQRNQGQEHVGKPEQLSLTHTAVEEDVKPLIWSQQSVLAFFSALLAVIFILLFEHDVGVNAFIPRHWTGLVIAILVTHACLGILVALTIQCFGILYRLVMGSLSICICIVLESMCFKEPVRFQELLMILLVVVGSTLYSLPSESSVVVNADVCAESDQGGLSPFQGKIRHDNKGRHQMGLEVKRRQTQSE
jgi:drug/metabolite transporter (DMT)-like permease